MTEITDDFGITVLSLAADPVARVDPTATVSEIARALVDVEVGALVVGEGGEVEGIVSERDVVRALAAGLDPHATCAADIAHRELIWCDASASITEVANEMMDRYVRHVLVEEDGRLVGIVSARDLLGAYASADLPEG
ncbi:MAG: cyclic nucleotide-binding/CBS domain-containing protein [Acidimicrobiia bacterium]